MRVYRLRSSSAAGFKTSFFPLLCRFLICGYRRPGFISAPRGTRLRPLPRAPTAKGLARTILAQPTIEGDPLKMLQVSDAFWRNMQREFAGQVKPPPAPQVVNRLEGQQLAEGERVNLHTAEGHVLQRRIWPLLRSSFSRANVLWEVTESGRIARAEDVLKTLFYLFLCHPNCRARV